MRGRAAKIRAYTLAGMLALAALGLTAGSASASNGNPCPPSSHDPGGQPPCGFPPDSAPPPETPPPETPPPIKQPSSSGIGGVAGRTGFGRSKSVSETPAIKPHAHHVSGGSTQPTKVV